MYSKSLKHIPLEFAQEKEDS